MFDIPLLINLFNPLFELKNIHQIKERNVNVKQIKQPNQSRSLEKRMTLAKNKPLVYP